MIFFFGQSDGPGKPLLYGTSKNFMDHFGLKSVKDLPKLKDLHIAENEIGMPNDLMDDLLKDEGIVSSDEETISSHEVNDVADEENTSTPSINSEVEQHLQNGEENQG